MREASDDATRPFSSVIEAVRAEVHRLSDRHRLGHWALTRIAAGASLPITAHDLCCKARGTDAAHAIGRLQGEVLTAGGSVVLPDVLASHGPLIVCPTRPEQVRAYLGVPVRAHDGSPTGVLSGIAVDAPRPELLAELPAVEATVRLLATLLETEAAVAREARRATIAEWEAHSDHATGLPNVRGWELMLDQEERRVLRLGVPAAVVYVDVDGLKEINDELGHAHGDLLLARAADALRGATRDQDFVARLGGDEFGVLFPDCDRVGAEHALLRIRAALELADVPASVGVASRPAEGTLKEAVAAADAAMYVAKRERQRGRSRPRRG